MAEDPVSAWIRSCRDEGLDPAEVRLVMGRYLAYRDFYQRDSRGSPLPLARWFEWYRIETASEATGGSPAADGCSVDSGAQNRGAIARPDAFLRALASLASVTSGS